MGSEALEISVMCSRTLSLILKLGGLMASLTAIDGGSPIGFGVIGDIGLLVVGGKSWRLLDGRPQVWFVRHLRA